MHKSKHYKEKKGISMDKWLHQSLFSIYKNGKQRNQGHFNQIQVCVSPDNDNEVEINFDCTQGEYDGSFVLCTMEVEEAELLVFRLNQVIEKIKKLSEQ